MNLFVKLYIFNKIILFINIIYVDNIKNDYDVKFQIMILGCILFGFVLVWIKINYSFV